MFTKPLVTAAALAAALSAVGTPLAAGTASAAGPAPARPYSTAAARCAATELADLTLEQQVGQLFVGAVDADRPSAAQLQQVSDLHLGGAILTGGSSAGVDAVRQVTDRVRAAATADGTGMWVAADQEGGNVQHLKGAGFDRMPTALAQGGTAPATLRAQAADWGAQLKAAGVDLDLAPVLDTVPADLGTGNAPIGYWDREFGHTPDVVAAHGTAFAQGMTDAGVTPAVKHFPGLGRVRENTDTSSDVTDSVTTRDDAYLRPFRDAIAAHAPVVMVSSAVYSRIDAGTVAAFSPTVLTGMLRGDLGFDGVIVSDDLGAAAAVADVPPGERATRFLEAGGTVVLSVDPDVVPDMVDAVVERARQDADFRATVEADVQRVLAAKAGSGLLPCARRAAQAEADRS